MSINSNIILGIIGEICECYSKLMGVARKNSAQVNEHNDLTTTV